MAAIQELEIFKAKKFSGKPALQGDNILTCHGIFMAILSEGSSVIENVPGSGWVADLVSILQKLGYQLERRENNLMVEGSALGPALISEPVSPEHEILLFALGGLFAGTKSPNMLTVSFAHIARKSLETFNKLFVCEAVGTPQEGSPTRTFKILGLRPVALERFPGEEYLVKTGILYYHAAAKTGTQLNCFNSGPNHLENILQSFCRDVQIVTTGAQELSEFEKRMARKLKTLQKPEIRVVLPNLVQLKGARVQIPNDVSLSSIYVLAATLIPCSEIELSGVLLNPSRSKFFTALRRMEANIEVVRKKEIGGEAYGDLKVKYSPLKGRKFDFESLYGMKDEIPLLIIAAIFAEGKSVFRDIEHLRTFEKDLLKQIILALKGVQVEIGEIEDGMVVQGRPDYDGHTYDTLNNAMLGFAYMILGLRSHGTTVIQNTECMERLFPGAIESLQLLSAA